MTPGKNLQSSYALTPTESHNKAQGREAHPGLEDHDETNAEGVPHGILLHINWARMYIVTDFGVPYVAKELRPFRPNRLAAIQATWAQCRAFDEKHWYEAVPNHVPKFSILQRLLAHTVYNPLAEIEVEWRIAGETSLPEIVAEVQKGLEWDDDGIQQWFGADEVLKLLRSATTFDEMLDRVECVCGGFEVDGRLRKTVDDVLGKNEASH